MRAPILEGMLERHRTLDLFLRERDELSLALDAEVLFKRSFVVASGSFCEQALMDVLTRFASLHGDDRLACFVRQRAIDRKYHDMFEWKASNANRFWGFFGDEFKEATLRQVKQSTELSSATKAFIDLGQLRNSVAHVFATASVDRTVDELADLLGGALRFLDFVESKLLIRQQASVPAQQGNAADDASRRG